jgi:hypothetical protein
VLRVAVATVLLAAAGATQASAAVDVGLFSVAPSTTTAGGHPNLRVSVRFTDGSSGLKDIALHLPGGLAANPRAASFCRPKRLAADLCPPQSKVGSVTVVGVAFGLELTVTRKIYNVRAKPGERLRLAVPIFGSLRRPGIAAELPVTARPADGGLDMAVTGLPREVNGISVSIKEVGFSFRGVVRTRTKKRRLRTRAFLTNPLACAPATSVLDVTSHDAPSQKIVRTSVFTPTGCGAPPPGG